MPEKGTTNVDVRVDCKLDSATTKGMYSSSIYTSGIYNGDIQKQFRTTRVKLDELEWKPRLQLIELLLLMRDIAVVA